jgi:hypothetical protein
MKENAGEQIVPTSLKSLISIYQIVKVSKHLTVNP